MDSALALIFLVSMEVSQAKTPTRSSWTFSANYRQGKAKTDKQKNLPQTEKQNPNPFPGTGLALDKLSGESAGWM